MTTGPRIRWICGPVARCRRLPGTPESRGGGLRASKGSNDPVFTGLPRCVDDGISSGPRPYRFPLSGRPRGCGFHGAHPCIHHITRPVLSGVLRDRAGRRPGTRRPHSYPQTQGTRKSAGSARGPCAGAAGTARTVGGASRGGAGTGCPGLKTGRISRRPVSFRHGIHRVSAAHGPVQRTGLEHARHQVRPCNPGRGCHRCR
jgi:hypothetical protein